MTSQAFAELEATIEKLPPYQLMQLHLKINQILNTFAPSESQPEKLDPAEAMRLFNAFSGSVSRDIDEKRERVEWRDEKYKTTR